MKIKLIPINQNDNQKNNSFQNNFGSNMYNDKPIIYPIINYEVSSENYNKEEIIDLKYFLSKRFNSSLDKFYINYENNPKEIQPKISDNKEKEKSENKENKEKEKLINFGMEDNIIFPKFLADKNNKGNFFLEKLSNLFDSNPFTLYYKEQKNYEYVSLELIYNMNDIKEIKLEVYSTCSIYVLKELIKQKEELKISDKSEIVLMNDEIPLDDNEIISDIYKEFLSKKNNINTNDNRDSFSNNENELIKSPLRLKIIKKGKKRFSIGINLNFNSMKNISKIKYSERAPDYREAKDGLNLLCYCRNEDCEINDEMFLVSRGEDFYMIFYLFNFL